MRKIIFFMAFALCALCVQAQEFNSDYKYKNILSNVSIGGSISYNRAVFGNNSQNIGADIRFTKRIHGNFRIRAIADVNGFLAGGFDKEGFSTKVFDRYGKAMIGASLDFMPFYLFVDYGANYNPSYTQSKFGAAADAGIGLGWNYFHFEAGADMANNGTLWQSNAFAKVGVDIPFALPEKERVTMSIENTMRHEYGELKGENKLLKSELQKCQEAGVSMQESATQMAAMVETLQAQLNESKTEVKTVKENCGKAEFYPIVFDFASYEITEAMDDYIADYAEMMQSNNYDYRILGYCSANGTDWKNQLLSEKRANAVYYRLIAYGVDKSRLFPEGKGMSNYDKASEQKVIIKRVD